MQARYEVIITNTKTGMVKYFYSFGDYPEVDKPIRRMEDETPIRDLPDHWDISIRDLVFQHSEQ